MPAATQPPVPINTGDADLSPDNTPSQYLIFRSLEATVGEEMLAKGAAKLVRSDDAPQNSTTKITSTSTVAHAGARPGSIRRAFLIRDRTTNDSWKFGFVEFAGVEDAQAAMARYISFDKFTIASKPVLVNYIHAGVFVPHLQPTPGSAPFTFPASANPALQLAYRDENGYASMLVVSTGANDPASQERKDSSSKAKDDKPKKRKADPTASTSEAKPKKQMSSHLQFWTNRGNELRGHNPSSSTTDTTSTPEPVPGKANDQQKGAAPPQQSYADPTKHCCYLCSRQFKTAPEVHKHERLSELHQTNLSKPELVEKAKQRLEKLGLPVLDSAAASNVGDVRGGDEAQEDQYRDRARERRKAYAQPKQPGFKGQGQGHASSIPATSSKTPNATTTAKPSSTDPTQADPPQPQSKAALMLQKMGHTPGTGLGAGSGSIQTDPHTANKALETATSALETNVYAAGVGLGAEGGNLGDAVGVAERATRGDYGDFVRDVRERARARFEREGG